MKYSLLGLLTVLTIFGCSKKEESSAVDGRVAVSGGSAINGRVTISSECGTNANLWVTSLNGTQALFNTTVANNGTFNFQLSPGTYTLNAQAGNNSCYVSAQLQTLTNNVSGYTVCLGSNCNQSYLNPNIAYSNTPTGSSTYYDATLASNTSCMWDFYGCYGKMYPGTGLVSVGKSNIYFSSKMETDFSLDLDFTSGSNSLASVPSLGKSGWRGLIKQSGDLVVDGAQFDSLFYEAQVDEKLLQFESGFCDNREKLVTRMSEYLKLSGFSGKVIGAFEKAWQNRMPPNETLCAYPQDVTTIQKVVTYKTSVPMEVRKLWFIIIPHLDAAMLKVKKMPAQYVQSGKPKVDALASIKKAATNRSIANEAPLFAEEWGIGFLLER